MRCSAKTRSLAHAKLPLQMRKPWNRNISTYVLVHLIFKHIFEYLQLYITFIFRNYCWLIARNTRRGEVTERKKTDRKEQNLKVPSHQIRSAWKWYGWIGLDMYSIWIAYGKRIFLSDSLFIYLKWSTPSGILLTCSTLHAIRGYCRQGVKRVTNYLLQSTTGYLSSFSILVKGNGAPHANSVKLHAVLNYPSELCQKGSNNFWSCCKGNLLPFGTY